MHIKSKRLGPNYESTSNNKNFIKKLVLWSSLIFGRQHLRSWARTLGWGLGVLQEISGRCVPPWVLTLTLFENETSKIRPNPPKWYPIQKEKTRITVEPRCNEPLCNEVLVITNDLFTPVIVKYIEKNLDIMNPHVSWPFVKSTFHCILITTLTNLCYW